jgi:hypothetical protein
MFKFATLDEEAHVDTILAWWTSLKKLEKSGETRPIRAATVTVSTSRANSVQRVCA